jgi:hypothetical protein
MWGWPCKDQKDPKGPRASEGVLPAFCTENFFWASDEALRLFIGQKCLKKGRRPRGPIFVPRHSHKRTARWPSFNWSNKLISFPPMPNRPLGFLLVPLGSCGSLSKRPPLRPPLWLRTSRRCASAPAGRWLAPALFLAFPTAFFPLYPFCFRHRLVRNLTLHLPGGARGEVAGRARAEATETRRASDAAKQGEQQASKTSKLAAGRLNPREISRAIEPAAINTGPGTGVVLK